jgi:hypothetical protein
MVRVQSSNHRYGYGSRVSKTDRPRFLFFGFKNSRRMPGQPTAYRRAPNFGA